MKIIFTFLSILFLTFLFNSTGNSQVIAGWDVSTQPGGTNNFGTSPLAVTDQASNVTIGSLTRGSGVGTTGTGAARGWGGNNWNVATSALAISGNKFVTFTVKANSGYTVSLSSINPFDYRRSSTGPPSGLLQYSLDGTNFTDIATVSFPTSTSSGDHVGATDLSGISALQNVNYSTTITFRIVPYSATGATGTWYIFDVGISTLDDFAITGTVAATGTPSLSLGASLTAFSQTSVSASAEQTYTIGGTNLTNAVTVTPPAGFEISKTTGTGFVNSTSNLTFTAAQVMANPTIYVILHAASSGSYSGYISHTSSDFATANKSVSGTYTAPCALSLTALIQGRYNGSVMVPDTVTVELHDASSFALVDQDKELLSASGTGTFTFSSAVNGSNYYIVVKHRNSIETWSTSAHSFTSSALNYNFTTAATQAYGSNMIQIGSKWCIYSGDVNQDGSIDSQDLSAIDNDYTNYAFGSGLVTDLNGDGSIDSQDMTICDNNYSDYITKNVPSGIPTPVFSITGTLTYFTQTSATPSTEQTYNISGTGLTANVTVVPPAGFEISKTTNIGFVNSTSSLVYTAANVMAGQTIYVRLNAGSAGSYSGYITHTSASAEFTQVTKSVSGSYIVISSNVNLTMGNPSNAVTDVNYPSNYLLVKPEFCASYNKSRGISNWVSWQYNSSWSGSAVRQDNYIPDPDLPGSYYHVTTNDYTGSGFSRGHMCPSEDRVNTQNDNDSLFVMTNMVPQNQYCNAGDWEGLENYERALALSSHGSNTVYIICGGYGAGGTTTDNSAVKTTIANGKVTVPAQLWKVMIVIPPGTGSDVSRVTTSTRTIGMLVPNDGTPNNMNTWGNYRVSVASIEALTGYTFFSNVPSSIGNVIKANVDTGPTQ
jgi:endonuclease G, mitochondrial